MLADNAVDALTDARYESLPNFFGQAMKHANTSDALRIGWLALSLGLLLGAGCSTFNREWKHASAQPAPDHDLHGQWEGTWQSDANAHSGRLRALITKQDNGRYLARFHAHYWKVLTFGYTVPLHVKESGGQFRFQGEADLGRLAGGKYTYEGQATPTNFFSAYRANSDRGTFRMQRPGADAVR